MHRSSCLQVKTFITHMLVDFDERGQHEMDFFPGGSIMDSFYCISHF